MSIGVRQTKEETASRVATLVVGIFGTFLLLASLGGICALLISAWNDVQVDLKTQLPSEGLMSPFVEMLNAIGDVSIGLFGPLLGFILGYYFTNRSTSHKE